MTFIIVFLACIIELTYLSLEPLRPTGWIPGWHAWLRDLGVNKFISSGSIVLAVGLPALVVFVLLDMLAGQGGFWSVVLHVAVLVASFGPKDLAREIDTYVVDYEDDNAPARASNDDNFLTAVESTAGAGDAPYLRAVALAAHDRVFAPAFWYVLAGPVGALVNRLVVEVAQATDHRVARSARDLLMWAPTRALGFGVGLVGTMVPVSRIYTESGAMSLARSELLLSEASLAALGDAPGDVGAHADPHTGAIKAMFSLMKRAVIAWLVLLALLVAAGVA